MGLTPTQSSPVQNLAGQKSDRGEGNSKRGMRTNFKQKALESLSHNDKHSISLGQEPKSIKLEIKSEEKRQRRAEGKKRMKAKQAEGLDKSPIGVEVSNKEKGVNKKGDKKKGK